MALLSRLLSEGRGLVRVDIGDDAAVLDWNAKNLVVSVDAQVQDTHFRLAWCSYEDIGYRATMAAMSDLAAMGAEPVAAVCALTLPVDFDDASLEAIARGQREACAEMGTALIGGNLSRAPVLSLTTTVFGSASTPRTRAGAEVGDGVFVAGALGLSRAGLLAFERSRSEAAFEVAKAHFRRPRARIREGLAMAATASACIDVSDGLAEDAARLARASGVAIDLHSAHIVRASGDALSVVASGLGEAALELALVGGEDYALLATGKDLPEPFVRIGDVREGQGLFVDATAVRPRGFSHF